VLPVAGCGTTSSTEVGVRTSLFGIFEKRGAQEVYQPGGVYFFMPFINSWTTLPTNQQNLLMTLNSREGDLPVRDDITFKTKDGNNVYIDVNVMWRIDQTKAGFLVSNVGQTVEEIRERIVRPLSRSVIRDIFNEITSEEYYQVAIKNEMAEKTRKALVASLTPYGILIDSLQVQQHRFDPAYQAAINAQKQAEADSRAATGQQKNIVVKKQSELEARRSEWNQSLEQANGRAGQIPTGRRLLPGEDERGQGQDRRCFSRGRGIRKEADALGKLGGDAREDAGREDLRDEEGHHRARRERLVDGREPMVDFLMNRAVARPAPAPRPSHAGAGSRSN
jgi:regulator of protease activity HflC (stomatin/prohibitin superfamily)